LIFLFGQVAEFVSEPLFPLISQGIKMHKPDINVGSTTLILIGAIREPDDYLKALTRVVPDYTHEQPGKLS
jgi:hypothetical protein